MLSREKISLEHGFQRHHDRGTLGRSFCVVFDDSKVKESDLFLCLSKGQAGWLDIQFTRIKVVQRPNFNQKHKKNA